MCGIVGCIGNKDVVPILINGLSKLEYRGYDSAGIVVHDGKILNILKTKGRLCALEEKLKTSKTSGNLGIGHTRWATHGSPSDVNSHPIYSHSNSIAVVHNGIIENYMQLKEELELKGYEFRTETDTETIANLIDFYYKDNNFLDAVFKTIERIEGSYALGIICSDFPDKIITARKDSPLIIGLGEKENFIASDVPAILNYTRKIHFLEDKEVAEITSEKVIIYDKYKKVVNKEVIEIDLDMDAAEKGGFEHFMLKEIYEQPKVIKDTLMSRLKEDGVHLDNIKLTKKELQNINKIYIVACGTASYAGLVGKSLIEKKVRIPVISEIASEFRYNDPIIDDKTLVIAVSQSGETADTLASIRLAKSKGARVMAIVNVVGSSIAREADDIFYTLAGPEIAVASTKAFSAQVVAMFLLTIHIGMELSKISLNEYKELKSYLEELPNLVDIVIQQYNKIEEFAKKYINSKNIFYIGRGLDYIVTLEGSLKLKELAYLHSESYAAGELKHGPIALMENDSLIIGVVTQENIFEKTASNISQCRSRGASVLAIAMSGNTEIEKHCDDVIYIPRTHQLFAPLLANIPQQLFAYFIAIGLGNDVDKPRNLAKSVTVE